MLPLASEKLEEDLTVQEEEREEAAAGEEALPFPVVAEEELGHRWRGSTGVKIFTWRILYCSCCSPPLLLPLLPVELSWLHPLLLMLLPRPLSHDIAAVFVVDESKDESNIGRWLLQSTIFSSSPNCLSSISSKCLRSSRPFSAAKPADERQTLSSLPLLLFLARATTQMRAAAAARKTPTPAAAPATTRAETSL